MEVVELSDYELERRKKIEKNKAFLQQLELSTVPRYNRSLTTYITYTILLFQCKATR